MSSSFLPSVPSASTPDMLIVPDPSLPSEMGLAKPTVLSDSTSLGPSPKSRRSTSRSPQPLVQFKAFNREREDSNDDSRALVSFEQSNSGSRRGSRKQSAVVDLSPHPIVSPHWDTGFRSRLKSVTDRNNEDSIRDVQTRRDSNLQGLYDDLVKRGEENDQRHERAMELHQKMKAERKYLENQQRVMQWTEMLVFTLVTHRFNQVVKEHYALLKLKNMFLPMIQRLLKVLNQRRSRAQLTRDNLENNPRPTATTLLAMKGNFFNDWRIKDCEDLISTMRPRSFKPKEFIMHDGDFDREMYFLISGSVKILLRDKGKRSKARNDENAKGIFPVKAPAYFGEFALLCKEPRSASIQCVEECHCWVVSQDAFSKVVDSLSPEVIQKLNDATDKRRVDNLSKFFPLRLEYLRNHRFLAHWDTVMLDKLNKKFIPRVLRAGTVLFKEGDYDPVLYIVGDGCVTLSKPSDPNFTDQALHKGDCFGVFETFFTHERRTVTATSGEHTEVWSITRELLTDLGMEDPLAMMESKRVLARVKAEQLQKPQRAPQFLLNDPYLTWALSSSQIHALWAAAEPRIVSANEQLTRDGEDNKGIYVITLGHFSITFGNRDLEDYNNELCINPVKRAVYSTIHSTAAEIEQVFPAVPTCINPLLEEAEHSARPNSPLSPSQMRHIQDSTGSMYGADGQARSASPFSGPGSSGIAGIAFGTFEVAAHRNRFCYSVRAKTQCDVWFIPTDVIEELLTPKQRDLLVVPNSVSKVVRSFNDAKPTALLDDHKHKVSTAMYKGMEEELRRRRTSSPHRRQSAVTPDPKSTGTALPTVAVREGARSTSPTPNRRKSSTSRQRLPSVSGTRRKSKVNYR